MASDPIIINDLGLSDEELGLSDEELADLEAIHDRWVESTHGSSSDQICIADPSLGDRPSSNDLGVDK